MLELADPVVEIKEAAAGGKEPLQVEAKGLAPRTPRSPPRPWC